jgi:hypothetical protein
VISLFTNLESLMRKKAMPTHHILPAWNSSVADAIPTQPDDVIDYGSKKKTL